MCVVSVAEADLAVLAIQEALVANGDLMGIAPEVAEHRFGTTEGGLGVDHPGVLEPCRASGWSVLRRQAGGAAAATGARLAGGRHNR